MKQLTLRDVANDLQTAIKLEASRRGMSMNRYVLSVLRDAVGLGNGGRRPAAEYHDLDHLAGTWTQSEADEFERHLAAQRAIDEVLWQ